MLPRGLLGTEVPECVDLICNPMGVYANSPDWGSGSTQGLLQVGFVSGCMSVDSGCLTASYGRGLNTPHPAPGLV